MRQEQQRVRFQDPVATSRRVPIPHELISTTAAPGELIYTVRDGVSVIVRQLAVSNSSGAMPVALTLYSVPPGGTAGAQTAELVGYSIPAQGAVDLTPLIGGFYTAGTELRALASVAGDLNIHGWAEEVL